MHELDKRNTNCQTYFFEMETSKFSSSYC